MNCIILCGGVGKRLWPLGRRAKPKQFHALFGKHTLLQQTYGRLRLGFTPKNIFVVTSAPFVGEIKKELRELLHSHIIIEPAQRDTAAAMGYAAAALMKAAPDEPCAFIPSDHYIDNARALCRALCVGEALIKKRNVMVDIGVAPTAPLTSLGYTKIGKKIATRAGVGIFTFEGHTEKPNKAVASRYLGAKQYLWHANYYMWTPRRFSEALMRYAPEVAKKLTSAHAYKTIQPISFDYAVTEKLDPKGVLILKADFPWSDVGSWSEVWAMHPSKTKQGNLVQGNVVCFNSRDNVVVGSGKRLVAIANIHNTVIVDSGDALLVCPTAYAQEVKKIVEFLEKRDAREYL